MRIRDILIEFAAGGSGDSGNYFQALASAWYNGTFDSGSLQKGIKSQQDVEQLLNRGIVAPDGKIRKYAIDYNADFDGVEIYSDDYYEHGDYDDTIDSRTGQKWGPYDFMEFSDDQLDEATGDQKFDSMMSQMTAEPKYPDQDMPPTSVSELIQWAGRNNKPYHEYFAQWARRNKFTNVNDALVWFGDNVDPSNPWGPKDFVDPFGRPAAEELEDAAKHDPKAAELMKVFRCYEEIVFDWPDEYRQMNMPDSRKGTDEGLAEGVRTESAELAKQYGWAYNQGEYGASMTHPKHGRISLSSPVTSRSGDTAVEREWTHNNASGIGDRSLAQHLQSLKEQDVAEGAPISGDGGAVDNFRQQMANNTELAYQKDMAEGNRKSEPPEADYGDDYQDMVKRVKRLAGMGPLKTQYDPARRVYRNMPTAVQPKK